MSAAEAMPLTPAPTHCPICSEKLTRHCKGSRRCTWEVCPFSNNAHKVWVDRRTGQWFTLEE